MSGTHAPARQSTRTILLAAAARIALAAGALAAEPALAHNGHEHGATTTAAPAPRGEVGAYGRDLPRGAAAPTDWSQPALRDDLGALHWPAGTREPRAQAYFDQGLRWAWAFNHAEAVRAFRAAQSLDPGCAMCFWGEAWALGPNINFPMDEASNARALEALATARRLAAADRGDGAAMRLALIEALAARHSPDPNAGRKALDAAYAEAMKAAQARFPEEAEVALLTADALMNLSPWDYWADGGRTPKGEAARIVELLEGVLGTRSGSAIHANPDHPGAIHLYIHTVEASDRPQRAAPHAARLPALMPGAGHIVHMPSHLWYRFGLWRESLEANRRAAAVDEAQLARGGASLLYAEGYYAHNVHFIMTSAMMGGDGRTAIEAAEKLARIVSGRAAREVPWTQPIQAAPYVARARFAEPQAVLALPAPDLPLVRGHWHYARGEALARLGRVEEAGAEARAIETLAEREDVAALDAMGLPARAVLSIAAQVVRGRAAGAAGDHGGGAALRRGGGDAGRPAVFRAALLVFPGAPVAWRRAAGGGAAAGGDRGIPPHAARGAAQRLGRGRPAARGRGDGRPRHGRGGAGAAGAELVRRRAAHARPAVKAFSVKPGDRARRSDRAARDTLRTEDATPCP